jgi:hypothetical protein
MSLLPPGETVTITVMGLVGKSAATTGKEARHRTRTIATTITIFFSATSAVLEM